MATKSPTPVKFSDALIADFRAAFDSSERKSATVAAVRKARAEHEKIGAPTLRVSLAAAGITVSAGTVGNALAAYDALHTVALEASEELYADTVRAVEQRGARAVKLAYPKVTTGARSQAERIAAIRSIVGGNVKKLPEPPAREGTRRNSSAQTPTPGEKVRAVLADLTRRVQAGELAPTGELIKSAAALVAALEAAQPTPAPTPATAGKKKR